MQLTVVELEASLDVADAVLLGALVCVVALVGLVGVAVAAVPALHLRTDLAMA